MFTDFSLDTRLLKALDALSFSTPTEVQKATIPAAMAGKDLLVTAETGSGKTAAFALPILNAMLNNPTPQSGARALILTPTRELAQQVMNHITDLSQFNFMKADTVCGGETFKPQAARLRKNPEILVATPGRLIDHLDRKTISLDDIEFLILDEADRMLDMGFQEDVERICNTCPENRQTMLFSATLAHTGMRSVITTSLKDPVSIKLNSHREVHSSIRQQVILSNDASLKDKQLVWLLKNDTFEKAIVFTNTIINATRLNGYLRYHDIRAGVIHGNLTQEQRNHAMGLLASGKINVLVATDVVARGIDVKGIDLVINVEMSRSGDDHTHRVGRTGRAGEQGVAISLIGPTEWNLMSSIERYLKTQFEKRVIKGLEGSYAGPKKLKASGKAAGSKKKKLDKKAAQAKPKSKTDKKKPTPRSGDSKNRVVLDGFAPLKRK
ncbi:DEAD/DEAH box helicase [Neptunomonas qingdaonensis]|uniref:Superfamily II DNA and RNA helicase n=1 Tax=Neptunomonas qingdaonensis TaxID=1045558 RepID=A0A1I2U125_9GAMM|nr:DEAD/DEAH box helicase [Neptunomonas qingdaonensis]SFG70693.1 Superfamily II DNA and RNA helicase [Neptunomonas qingdaonensis]